MSQMERGERPAMQEQEDSEEGEAPADPSAGEWLQAIVALAPGRPHMGCVAHRRPQRAMSAGQCRRAAQRPWGLQVTSSPGGGTRKTPWSRGAFDLTECHLTLCWKQNQN